MSFWWNVFVTMVLGGCTAFGMAAVARLVGLPFQHAVIAGSICGAIVVIWRVVTRWE